MSFQIGNIFVSRGLQQLTHLRWRL